MKRYFLPLWMIYLFAGCIHQSKTDPVKEKEAMEKADRDFSDLSKQKGRNNAFLHYIDSDAVLLRPDHDPIIGNEAIQFFGKSADSTYSLTWEPSGAGISSAGDMGFTYGIWTFQRKDQPADSAEKGTYVTIWKKQDDGSWKFVLDTGNPGLGKK